MAKPKPTMLTAEQDRFVRMEANGYSSREIIRELWGVEETDSKYHALACKLTRWRKHPAYMDTWKDEIQAVSVKLMNKGLGKILHQMESNTDWLANKAANDGINFARSRIFAEEDSRIHVSISGMPEIGSPDQDEQ